MTSMQPLAEAEKSAAEFKEFLYIISHDFGAPLRAVVEFSRLLKDEYAYVLNDEAKEYLSLIMDGGEKMQRMLAALTQYSRLSASTLSMTAIDTNTVFAKAKEAISGKITASKAIIDAAELPSLQGDATQIQQLFVALLDNALTYQPAGNTPQVAITLEDDGAFWRFIVRDNGIGLDPQYYHRVFMPFRRMHAEDEYPGLGMGLTMAKKIVERHGGTIWIESTKGQGMRVVFTLLKKQG